ncbi:LytR C-terminal domain-containing protein [candidate division WOR-3 bacterium]|nr:LytR C-terminal domain-containing protein [candidate division WOR-3 bacterium]
MKQTLAWLLAVVLVVAAGASITWRILPEPESDSDAKLLRMEIANGCGVPRAGRAVADELQMRGYDIYAVRDYREHLARTTVVDLREPTGANARTVARALSVQRRWRKLPLGPKAMPEVIVELDSSRYLEVRLVIGDDYRRFFANVVPLY